MLWIRRIRLSLYVLIKKCIVFINKKCVFVNFKCCVFEELWNNQNFLRYVLKRSGKCHVNFGTVLCSIERCAALWCVADRLCIPNENVRCFYIRYPITHDLCGSRTSLFFISVYQKYSNESRVYRSLKSKNLVERCALTSNPTNVSVIIIIII